MAKKKKHIRRLLIANRGEIAVRIIRTCREMGITPIAVYSDCDASALHVRMADEAYYLGATAPAESYLSIPRLIKTAKLAKADAIHPGYGFLAENAAFAKAVTQAKIIWIGPSAKIIDTLGSKTGARQLATRAKVPIVPGTTTPVKTLAAAKKAAAKIGYPILLKAIAGGGGKGMRIIATEKEFSRGFALAKGEAQSAFGNGDLYIEKYIAQPHHVEIQILADTHGNVVHLGERECSIQRRHQKLIEETPSPFITEETRIAMCAAAVRLVTAAGYTNAGTVEFLVDGAQNFYFLEVNTRIQVEHPVTELVTGIDVVREQIRIAAGETLRLAQKQITFTGHAIECRLCAEDPFQQFIPSPGAITDLLEAHGSGVRMDSGIAAGDIIPMAYDPLMGKLCTWGTTRQEAIARMQRALRECRVSGIKTNLYFHRQVMKHKGFNKGQYTTQFIDQELSGLLEIEQDDNTNALIAAAVAKALKQTASPRPNKTSTWREIARKQGVRSGMEYL